APGARLLAAWVSAPLTNPDAITARQDAWSWMLANATALASLRVALRSAPDIARALARLSLNRGGPRDLAALRDGLAGAQQAEAALDGPLPPVLAAARAALMRRHVGAEPANPSPPPPNLGPLRGPSPQ